MKCILCNQLIKNYDVRFHHLKIDDTRSVDICLACSDKFAEWQSSVLANLFPTSTLKKRFKKK